MVKICHICALKSNSSTRYVSDIEVLSLENSLNSLTNTLLPKPLQTFSKITDTFRLVSKRRIFFVSVISELFQPLRDFCILNSRMKKMCRNVKEVTSSRLFFFFFFNLRLLIIRIRHVANNKYSSSSMPLERHRRDQVLPGLRLPGSRKFVKLDTQVILEGGYSQS